MALKKKPKTEAPEKEPSKVEDQKAKIAEAQAKIQADKDAGATADKPAPVKEPEVVEPEAETTDTKEVATKAAAGAITKPNGKVALIFSDLKNVMVAPYGTFPRIKTGSGNFTDGDIKYGTWLKFEMLSYNELYVITPNDNSQDKEVQEAVKEAIKYSYDGVNLDDGSGTVADYVSELKADGWKHAAVKNYRECVGILHDCDNKAQAEDNIGQIVQLQLSPTSRDKHEGYIMASSFHVNRGVFTEEEATVMMIKAKAASGGGFDWTKFTFTKADL